MNFAPKLFLFLNLINLLTAALISLGSNSTNNILAVIAIIDSKILMSYKMMTPDCHFSCLSCQQSCFNICFILGDKNWNPLDRHWSDLEYFCQYCCQTSCYQELSKIDIFLLYVLPEKFFKSELKKKMKIQI